MSKMMNFTRLGVCVLGSTLAAACSSANTGTTEPIATSSAAVESLPRGIHLGEDGLYRQDVCDHSQEAYCFLTRALPAGWHPGDKIPETVFDGSSAPANTMTPTDVLAAYKIPGSSSAGGKIVAIIDSADSNALSDVAAYRKGFGLPALPQCTGSGLPDPSGGTPCFSKVNQSGGQVNVDIGDGGADADTETSLDMDMISAACPDCSILLVQINSLTDANIHAGALTAVSLGAAATSISIGGAEGKGDPTGYSTSGHLVLAAAGDSGYDLGGKTPSYPASAPDIVSVGGTNLKKSGTTYTQPVWKDSGSGCSTEFAMPAYQTAFGASKFGGCKMRAANDVAAAAYFADGSGIGGIAIYVNKGGWTGAGLGGTSASSPLVAAIFTRLGVTDAISKDFGFMYTNIDSFEDVTKGNNEAYESCGTILCTAGTGWDGPSGVGTPNGKKLAKL